MKLAIVGVALALVFSACGELQIQGPDIDDSRHILILCLAQDTVWFSPRLEDFVVCEDLIVPPDTTAADTTGS